MRIVLILVILSVISCKRGTYPYANNKEGSDIEYTKELEPAPGKQK